jgi:hypothetical protein
MESAASCSYLLTGMVVHQCVLPTTLRHITLPSHQIIKHYGSMCCCTSLHLLEQLLYLVHSRLDLPAIIYFHSHWMSFIAYAIAFAGPTAAIAASAITLAGISIDCAAATFQSTEVGSALCLLGYLTRIIWAWASHTSSPPAYIPKQHRGWNPVKRHTTALLQEATWDNFQAGVMAATDCLAHRARDSISTTTHVLWTIVHLDNLALVAAVWNHAQDNEDDDETTTDGPYATAANKCSSDHAKLLHIEEHRAIAHAHDNNAGLSIRQLLLFIQALKGEHSQRPHQSWRQLIALTFVINSYRASTTAAHDHRYDLNSSTGIVSSDITKSLLIIYILHHQLDLSNMRATFPSTQVAKTSLFFSTYLNHGGYAHLSTPHGYTPKRFMEGWWDTIQSNLRALMCSLSHKSKDCLLAIRAQMCNLSRQSKDCLLASARSRGTTMCLWENTTIGQAAWNQADRARTQEIDKRRGTIDGPYSDFTNGLCSNSNLIHKEHKKVITHKTITHARLSSGSRTVTTIQMLQGGGRYRPGPCWRLTTFSLVVLSLMASKGTASGVHRYASAEPPSRLPIDKLTSHSITSKMVTDCISSPEEDVAVSAVVTRQGTSQESQGDARNLRQEEHHEAQNLPLYIHKCSYLSELPHDAVHHLLDFSSIVDHPKLSRCMCSIGFIGPTIHAIASMATLKYVVLDVSSSDTVVLPGPTMDATASMATSFVLEVSRSDTVVFPCPTMHATSSMATPTSLTTFVGSRHAIATMATTEYLVLEVSSPMDYPMHWKSRSVYTFALYGSMHAAASSTAMPSKYVALDVYSRTIGYHKHPCWNLGGVHDDETTSSTATTLASMSNRS